MARQIRNTEIRDALIAMGFIKPGTNVDINGAQSGYFKNGLMINLGITEDQFKAAKTLAGWDGNPDNQGNVMSDLGKVGITLNTTGEAATMHQRLQDVSAGKPPSVEIPNAPAPAAAPPPTPGVTPAPAAAPSGVTMGTTRSRATPGVAALTPTPSGMAAPTPAPTGAATPGGGGPSDKTTVDDPKNWNDDKIKTWLKQNLGGTDAWFIDIPEVWDAMSKAVRAGKNATQVDGDFMATSFYQHNDANARGWYAKERADPPSAARDVATQTQAIQKLAQDAGINIDPVRAQQMATSYLRYGWTQTDLQRAIGAEWHYDPSTKQQATAVTQMKSQAQDWLVPLSDQAIQTWGQGLISGTVTQDQYTQYLRDNAKSLMPQLSTLIDQHAGDPKFSVSTFADPYKQHAANLLGLQPDQIDLNDSKWRQALDYADPKTGERRIMTLGEWESKIKTDKSFGYDNSANGIQDGLALAQSLKTSMGF